MQESPELMVKNNVQIQKDMMNFQESSAKDMRSMQESSAKNNVQIQKDMKNI